MVLFNNRPKNLPFRTKDGLYMTWLPEDNNFEVFVNNSIQWSVSEQRSDTEGPNKFALIDTFFADFIEGSPIKNILEKCTQGSPFKMLLIDPSSPYAKARVSAIDVVNSYDRAAEGIKKLIDSISGWALEKKIIREKPIIESNDYFERVRLLEKYVSLWKVPIKVKYYSAVPSGPRLFLNDILIAGHFCVNNSSLNFPWLMLVNNPDTNRDSFDVFQDEFDTIWNDFSVESPVTSNHDQIFHDGHTYFISYSSKNANTADHVETLLRRSGRHVLRDETGIPGGGDIDDNIDAMIEQCDTLIAIWSKDFMDSNICKGEAFTADEINKKRVCFLKTEEDLDSKSLPIALRGSLYINGVDRSSRENSIKDIIKQEDNAD